MTRIIAGDAGGARLEVPRSGTRPTSDRVREALFSSLEARGALEGAEVLDLFAGTGALGFEAVSRGARSCVLVEKAPKAAALLRRNSQVVRDRLPASRSRLVRLGVVAADARSFVERDGARYDLVLCDPPYELASEALAELLELLEPRLAPHALVVVERAARDTVPEPRGTLRHTATKRYGDTVLLEYEPAEDPYATGAVPGITR